MRQSLDLRPVIAGLAYFASVFAVGFVLGAIRTVIIQADADEATRLIAVLIELPVMLGVSWVICGILVRRFAVPPLVAPRLVMGIVALSLVLVAELAVGVFLMGRSVSEHLLAYAQPSHALGLAAQLCFAAFPAIRTFRE